MSAELELGIVAGARHVDAVVMDRRGRLHMKVTARATGDVRTDLGAAVRAVIASGSVDPPRIKRLMMVGNRRTSLSEWPGLNRVGILRIGSPLTHALPPLSGWPAELRTRVSAGEAIVPGGAEYDGRPAAALDEDAIARFLDEVAGEADGMAITSVFSPVAPDQELAAAEIVRRELGPSTHVSLSHEIGSVGLLERENATVLNGALVGAVEITAAAIHDALESEGVDPEVFVTQNDGTLMTLQHALRFPVLVIGNGPASAMRGAAYLSGVEDGLVVDVGPNEMDVGALVGGLPRESAGATRIEGVRVAFRTPDVRTLPFGGGSLADLDEGARETLRLAREALADSVDRAKAELEAPPLVAVGAADELVPDDLPGVSEVIRPPDRDVARAIGAAMAPVSGRAETICSSRPDKRQAALDELRASACAQAVYAGADPLAVTVVQVEEQPLTYLADPAVRIRVKAAGPAG
ncbi:MAG: hypothetical protein QOG86_360 [Thermoleophilaceae bacterium]|nr:hypothetical protein [Thermoleophilaceae bacterium]